jgi:hypothetical protein
LKRRDNYEYMHLDGMPFVIAPNGTQWVFSRTKKRWVPAREGDDWDAVYMSEQGFKDIFTDDVPDLPEEATTPAVKPAPIRVK